MNQEIKTDGRMYWCFGLKSLECLIPKKRGTGFMKQLVGHHGNDLSRFCEYDLQVDTCGLDGYLDLYTGSTDGREEELKKKVEELAKFLKVEHVQVDRETFYKYLLHQHI